MRVAITLSSFSILLLAIWSSWSQFGRFSWFYMILWLPTLYFTLLHMVFVGSVRYREPALLVLIPLAACAVARWMHYAVERPATPWMGPHQGNEFASTRPT